MFNIILRFFFALFLVTRALSVCAEGIKVSPIRIEVNSRQAIAVLKVSNPGETPLLIQSELFKWTQIDGEDVYEPSQDILVIPPLFTLEPHQEQTMRVALLRPADAKELAYRLYLQEIKQKVKISESSSLNIALRIGIPIFVAPQIESREEFAWEISHIEGTGLVVKLQNNGNLNLFINALEVLKSNNQVISEGKPVFKYLLPEQNTQWTIMLQSEEFENDYTIKAKINGREIIRECPVAQ